MTDHFDKWINSMSDEEYSDMLDESNPFGFTDAQEEKALNIRQAPTTEELEDLELEQEFQEPDTTDVTVSERVTTERELPREEPRIVSPPPVVTPPITTPVVTPPKPPQVVEQVKKAVVSAGRFIRRFFKV